MKGYTNLKDLVRKFTLCDEKDLLGKFSEANLPLKQMGTQWFVETEALESYMALGLNLGKERLQNIVDNFSDEIKQILDDKEVKLMFAFDCRQKEALRHIRENATKLRDGTFQYGISRILILDERGNILG